MYGQRQRGRVVYLFISLFIYLFIYLFIMLENASNGQEPWEVAVFADYLGKELIVSVVCCIVLSEIMNQ